MHIAAENEKKSEWTGYALVVDERASLVEGGGGLASPEREVKSTTAAM